MLKIVYLLISINVIFDIGLWFTGYGSYLSIIRLVIYIFLVVASLREYNFKSNFINAILFFSTYIFIMFFFVSDIEISLKVSLKVIFSMLSLLIGYVFINDNQRLSALNNFSIFAIVLLIINFAFSTIFKIGIDTYTGTEDFLVGNYDDNWNVFTYLIIISPLIIKQYFHNKLKLTILLIIYFILLLITILSMKRIAIAGVLFGLSIFILLNFRIVNYVKYIFIIVFVLYLFYPFYSNILLKRYEARKDKYEFSEDNLENEGRFIESSYVWDQIFSFDDPIKSIFGLEAFNSLNNYGNRFVDRNLHVDYNLIANTNGLFGLFLYGLIYFFIIKRINLLRRKSVFFNIPELKLYYTVCYSLIFTSLLTSFAGQMYAITFRTIIFLYLGAMIKLMEKRINYECSYCL